MFYGRKYAKRHDFRVAVEASKENPKKVLHQSLQKFFKRMRETNPKFMIHLWKDKGDKQVLLHQEYTPTMLRDLHCYFNQANPKPKGGPFYMNIWVILNLADEQLVKENQWWL